ncbi:MAG: DUF4129 domain-containing protein [Chloroflexi bacterium]|nr:DUF4129 domain-containing protein [Chloroflexota bacterium]
MIASHRIDQLLRAVRPVLLLVMVVCWAVPVVGTLENVLPGWNGTFLLVVAVLVGLEAIASERLRVRQGIRGADLRPYRLAELGLLVVGALLLPYVWRGWDALLTDLARWSTDYIAIFSVEYLLSLVWCLGLWFVVTGTIRDLDHLEVPQAPAESPRRSGVDARQDIKPDREGQDALDRLQSRFLWGGGALLLFAVVARLGTLDQPPFILEPLLDGLIYFAVGLFLLSQARLALLRLDAWGSDTVVDDTVPRRWLVYGAVFLLVVMMLAALLPTSYTLGLLDVLRAILGLVVMAFLSVLNAILWFYAYLLALLFSLLGLNQPDQEVPTAPAPAPAAPPLQLLGPPLRLDEWVQSAIFWVVIVLTTGYVVFHFVRTRRHLLGPLLELGWVQSLLRWLAGLRRGLGHLAGRARQLRLPARSRPGALNVPMPAAPWRFLSLSRLSPRELVLYFYRSIVQRAGQHGHPRQPAQTPYEYSAALREQLPGAQAELDVLTTAFVEARYSVHDIDPDRAVGVRRVWEAVK